MGPLMMLICMLLGPAPDRSRNPWVERVEPAVTRAEQTGSSTDLLAAFDTAWRADDWKAGVKLCELAQQRHANRVELLGALSRAYWRAGNLAATRQAVSRMPADTTDRIALAVQMDLAFAVGNEQELAELAARYERTGPQTAGDLSILVDARLFRQSGPDLLGWLRRIEKTASAENGYPETLLVETVPGVADFLAAIGDQPVNQVKRSGSVEMLVLGMLHLPYCQVRINGHGPYRMVVDTGGSVTVSLDAEIAEEIGLRSLASAKVHGAAGAQDSGQALVERLTLGEIEVQRVPARVFELPAGLKHNIDGILGTGVFDQARLTLDFAGQKLVVEPSSATAARGNEAELLILGDAKLVAPVKLAGREALAFIDTGADIVAASPSTLRELYPDRELMMVEGGVGVGEGDSPGLGLGMPFDLEFAGRALPNYSGFALETLDELLSSFLRTRLQLIIGMPLCREMKSFTVDFPRRKLWVEWLKP